MNLSNNRCYVGQKVQTLKRRVAGHKTKPPKKMLKDVHLQGHSSFWKCTELTELQIVHTQEEADKAEERNIQRLKPHYNTLRGTPTKSRKFLFLYRRNLLPSQRK